MAGTDYDVVVLGTGASGLVAAGARVALVEKVDAVAQLLSVGVSGAGYPQRRLV